jgi:uncharacterized protein YbjQ (UPF0145 family)
LLVTTGLEIPGYRIIRHVGVVRGMTIRSRAAAAGNVFGNLQSVFGGRLSIYQRLAETARQEALDAMCRHASEGGANAVIGMRYHATEIMAGVTEVLAYGTAVCVDPAPGPP